MAINYPAELTAIKAPILAIAGSKDDVVLPSVAQTIAAGAKNKKSRALILEGADHTFLVFSGDLSMLHTLTGETIAWFKKTL